MTRSEFIENVDGFGELIDFCYENDCDICDDVYNEEGRDERIDEEIYDFIRCDSWQSLMDALSDIPTDGDYYRWDGELNFVSLDDDDFQSFKQSVLDWADESGAWDDDEDEEYGVPANNYVEDGSEPLICDEAFQISDLLGISVN